MKKLLGRYKNSFKRKGWILPYVLIVTFAMLFLVTYAVEDFGKRDSYIESYSKNLLKEDEKQREKEYLMAMFNSYVNDNLEKIEEVGIEEFFKEGDTKKFFGCPGRYIRFLVQDNAFEIKVYQKEGIFYPKLLEEEGKVVYEFK